MNRAKTFLLLAALGLAAGAYAGDRLLSETQLIQKLNGSPQYLGTVYSLDGLSHNNWNTTLVDAGTTAATFDAGFGDMLKVVCTIDQFCATGTSTKAATANDEPVVAGEKYFTLLTADQNAVACIPQDGGIGGKCKYFHMR